MKRIVLIWLAALSLVLAGCQPAEEPSQPGDLSSTMESSSEPSFQELEERPASSAPERSSESNQSEQEDAGEQVAAQRAAEQQADAQKAEEEHKAQEMEQQQKLENFSAYASGDAFLSKVEKKVIELTNDERERNSLNRLETDSTLGEAARIRSRELYENDHFDHTRPNGDSWVTVLTQDLLYAFHHAGENLASVEYNDPSGTYAYDGDYWVTTWIESPPHYENMLRDTYTKIGVGIYLAQEGDMTIAYATTIFSD